MSDRAEELADEMTEQERAKVQETRPEGCRFRLQDEGKLYPKSSCAACGKTIMTGLGKECTSSAPAVRPAPADLREVVAKAVAYAEQLATDLHAKHFPDVTQWRLLSGDLVGILTQIDNMTVGLATSRPPSAGDDLGNGRVAVPAASIRAVLDTVQEMRPGQFWAAHSTDNFADLRAMLAAAKEG